VVQALEVAGSIPDEIFGFRNSPTLSGRTVPLRSTQPLTQMNARNISFGKGRPARKPDILTAICEPIVLDKIGSLIFHNPIRLHGLLWR
jgi:hypothetical protein